MRRRPLTQAQLSILRGTAEMTVALGAKWAQVDQQQLLAAIDEIERRRKKARKASK